MEKQLAYEGRENECIEYPVGDTRGISLTPIGSGSQQNDSGKLIGILQRIRQHEQTTPGMPDENRLCCAQLLQRFMEKPRLVLRRHYPFAGTLAISVSGPVEYQHPVLRGRQLHDTRIISGRQHPPVQAYDRPAPAFAVIMKPNPFDRNKFPCRRKFRLGPPNPLPAISHQSGCRQQTDAR